MSGFQQVTILGNAGQDAELKAVGNDGKEVIKFNVAVSGGKDKPTMWGRVTYWLQANGNQSWLATAIKKGDPVLVVGTLQFDAETGGPKVYTKNDSTPGASFEITASHITPLGNRNRTAEPETDEIPF
jgi:single-strand DNA-binding protein